MDTGRSVTVFTTPEHHDVFRSVAGDDADFRLDPYQSLPLDTTLENVRIGGGTLAVLDEDHFFDVSHMAEGLKAYVRKPENRSRLLRLVLYCADRAAGDAWLDFFAGYLGIFDVVHGVRGADAVCELGRVIGMPNTRWDILPLLIDHRPKEEPDAPKPIVLQEGGISLAGCGLEIHISMNPAPQAR